MSNDSPSIVTPAAGNATPQALEQYKAKLADLGNLGGRHTAMTTYYVTIVSALFGLLALKEHAIADIETSVLLVVCGVGFLVCVLWFFNLSFFRNLFRAKLTVLTQMEATLPYQTFAAESKIMLGQRINGWVRIERMVPIVFGLLFMALVVIRITKSVGCVLQ